MSPAQALTKMRELTQSNIPFELEYVSCNISKGESDGLKRESKVLLRTGMNKEISYRSEILIGYTREPEGVPRWFYLPLLTKFNGITIKP
jgi:hypothetical protein